MKSVENMTPQELRVLADKKEEESKIVKIGYLNRDLYNFDSNSINGYTFHQGWGSFWLLSETEKDQMIENFKSRFSLVLPKGTKFVCYVIDGFEHWWDDVNYGIEDMDAKWAATYLEGVSSQV